jgi:hypothetical protein
MYMPIRPRKKAPRNTYVMVISGRLAMPGEWGSERTGMVEIIRRVSEEVRAQKDGDRVIVCGSDGEED